MQEFSSLTDINNHGQIVGQGPEYEAMLYTPGIGFKRLGKLGYAIDTSARAINDLTKPLSDEQTREVEEAAHAHGVRFWPNLWIFSYA